MNKILLIAAAAATLAGCNKTPTRTDNTASNSSANAAATTSAPAATNMVTANGSPPGTYDVTDKKGTKTVAKLMADGTFVDTDASGKEIDKGTWNVKDGKTCFTPTGKTAECYKESAVGADGSFTATSDKETVTVKKAS
jgi:hypothetical protein